MFDLSQKAFVLDGIEQKSIVFQRMKRFNLDDNQINALCERFNLAPPNTKKQRYSFQTMMFNLSQSQTLDAWLSIGWDAVNWSKCKILKDLDRKYCLSVKNNLIDLGYCKKLSFKAPSFGFGGFREKIKMVTPLSVSAKVIDSLKDKSYLSDEKNNIVEINDSVLSDWSGIVKNKLGWEGSSVSVTNEELENTPLERGVLPFLDFHQKHQKLERQTPNGRWVDVGGRVYSTVSALPQDTRLGLTWEGKPLEEWDMKASHIYMLYAKQGSLPPADSYHLPDLSADENDYFRELNKQILLTLINCAAGQCYRAVASWAKMHPVYCRLDSNTIKSHITQLKARHATIASAFESDTGVRLQGLEGRLCLFLGHSFTLAQKPIITIFDSFMILKEDRGFLNAQIKIFCDKEFFGIMPTLELKTKAKPRASVALLASLQNRASAFGATVQLRGSQYVVAIDGASFVWLPRKSKWRAVGRAKCYRAASFEAFLAKVQKKNPV